MTVYAEMQSPSVGPHFPSLRQGIPGYASQGLVILFHDFTSGVVVMAPPNEPWSVGDYSRNWNGNEFEKFKGKIVLENR